LKDRAACGARTRPGRREAIGYLFGALTAVCWGTSPIFIRRGLEGLPSALWGIAIGLTTASIVVAGWVGVRIHRHRLTHVRVPREALWFMVLGGSLAALGSVSRTRAIDLAPVAVAISLAQTTSLFTLLFVPLFLGRHRERVTPRLFAGAALVVGGSVLIVWGLR
jgi:drug/metabolite transporter (DMT)-like permease